MISPCSKKQLLLNFPFHLTDALLDGRKMLRISWGFPKGDLQCLAQLKAPRTTNNHGES
jgi:hypothetical protein